MCPPCEEPTAKALVASDTVSDLGEFSASVCSSSHTFLLAFSFSPPPLFEKNSSSATAELWRPLRGLCWWRRPTLSSFSSAPLPSFFSLPATTTNHDTKRTVERHAPEGFDIHIVDLGPTYEIGALSLLNSPIFSHRNAELVCPFAPDRSRVISRCVAAEAAMKEKKETEEDGNVASSEQPLDRLQHPKEEAGMSRSAAAAAVEAAIVEVLPELQMPLDHDMPLMALGLSSLELVLVAQKCGVVFFFCL